MSEAEWDAWDKQIEEGLKSGRLDKLIEEAKEDYKRGLTLTYEEGMRKFDQTHLRTKSTE